MNPGSSASPAFWDRYYALPEEVRRQADKQFEVFSASLNHPSLQLKPVGEFWSVRINLSYRALAVRRGDQFYWFWIGTHREYERFLK